MRRAALQTMSQPTTAAAPAEHEQLREDIRLLGGVLGRVLREQKGEEGYACIETVRQTAVRFRRGKDTEVAAARAELERLLNSLPIERVLDVVRAFSYFLQFVNLCEDAHAARQLREQAGARPAPGTLARTLEALHRAGVDGAALLAWSGRAQICPVLTAHPTEV